MINLQPSIFLPSVQLTANGVTDMGCAPSNVLSLKVDGVFGGATCEIGYVSDSGIFTRYSDIAATTGNLQLASLFLGFWSSIAVRITGATSSTNVRVHWYPQTIA
jgi:hypothetical protein